MGYGVEWMFAEKSDSIVPSKQLSCYPNSADKDHITPRSSTPLCDDEWRACGSGCFSRIWRLEGGTLVHLIEFALEIVSH